MLPPLHKLSLGPAGDEEEPTGVLPVYRDLPQEVQDLIEEALVNDPNDPCMKDMQRLCGRRGEAPPDRALKDWCEVTFMGLCYNPPRMPTALPAPAFNGAFPTFLCGPHGFYNPYDSVFMQWRRQFALFCKIIYGDWDPNSNYSRNDVIDTLKQLSETMTHFPPIVNTPFQNTDLFKGLQHFDIDYLPPLVDTIGAEAFCECPRITRMRLPEGLLTIGFGAFSQTGLVEIDIPDSVRLMHWNVFTQCTRLRRVRLPQNALVQSIPNMTFHGCAALESIDIPDFVRTIRDMAFYRCTSLATIRWSIQLHQIQSHAFSGCNALTDVTLPESLQYLEHDAFAECASLTTVDQVVGTTQSRLGVLNPGTFQQCALLREVPLLRSIVRIHNNVFDGCTALQSTMERHLPFHNALVTIGTAAFQNCRALEYVHLPDSVTALGERVFYGCSNLREIRLPENNDFMAISTAAFFAAGLQRIRIPRSVIRIESSAFLGCSVMNTVVFDPDPNAQGAQRVRVVDQRAFAGCNALRELTLPPSLVFDIRHAAFENCDSLARVDAAFVALGSWIFRGCTSMHTFTFGPDSTLDTIGDDCFERCALLTQLELPNTITHIGNRAFHRCVGLQEVRMPASLTHLGRGAFAECSSLTSIAIPAGLRWLREQCFRGCTNLRTVTFAHDGRLDRMSDSAFHNCTSLEEIAIPYRVRYMSRNTFAGCTSLRRVTFLRGPNNEPPILTRLEEGLFAECVNIEALEIPASVTFVARGAIPPEIRDRVTEAPGRTEPVRYEE